jgi:hypothetical protein
MVNMKLQGVDPKRTKTLSFTYAPQIKLEIYTRKNAN